MLPYDQFGTTAMLSCDNKPQRGYSSCQSPMIWDDANPNGIKSQLNGFSDQVICCKKN